MKFLRKSSRLFRMSGTLAVLIALTLGEAAPANARPLCFSNSLEGGGIVLTKARLKKGGVTDLLGFYRDGYGARAMSGVAIGDQSGHCFALSLQRPNAYVTGLGAVGSYTSTAFSMVFCENDGRLDVGDEGAGSIGNNIFVDFTVYDCGGITPIP